MMDSNDLIKTLTRGFYAECAACGEEFALKDAGLFDQDHFTPEALEVYEAQLEQIRDQKAKLKKLRERGAKVSETAAKSTNIGFILERLAPTLKGFRFDHNDCRSLFDPIDYLIFEGLSSKGKVDRIFFTDIKTGAARLSKLQKEIRTVVEKKNVGFKTY